MQRLAIAVALCAVALAGCADAPPEPAPDKPDPCLIERPDDLSCLEGEGAGANATQRPHLHDYWGGQDRLVVMDATEFVGALAIDSYGQRFMMRPEGDSVVPQGTARVDVLVEMEDLSPGHYGDTELWVVTAAEREPRLVGPIVSGETLTIETTNEDNDLPHQRLSAWQFILHVESGDPIGVVWIQMELTMKVEAVRGLDIPLYPGHPDAWQGRDAIGLFERSPGPGALHGPIEVGPVSGSPCILSCLDIVRPDDGAIVPFDADHVEVAITHDQPGPLRMGLEYHGAASREFVRLDADEDDGTTRVYRIPVDGHGDGPYAMQSLWEFRPFVDGATEDGAYAGSYTMTARALPPVGA